jgi:hypothetical protein
MRFIAQIHPPDTTRNIVQCLRLPARPYAQETPPFESETAA